MHYAIKLGDSLNHERQKYKCNEKSSSYWQCCYLGTKQPPAAAAAAGNNLVKHCSIFTSRRYAVAPYLSLCLSVCLSICHVREFYPDG